MILETSWPLAVPVLNGPYCLFMNSCRKMTAHLVSLLIPPTGFNISSCLYKYFKNDSFDKNVVQASFTPCFSVIHVSTALCAGPGQVLVCVNDLTYSLLPATFTVLCVLATLLPDIEIIPGDEPIKIPSIDHVSPRQKRSVQFIPILLGLGISQALATGSPGMVTAIKSYPKMTQQFAHDVRTIYISVQEIKDQNESLAKVVLQKRRGLVLLPTCELFF